MDHNPLLARIETSRSLPTLPHILLLLIETCNRREKGIKDLAKIINQDPSLSERVLRLVNSAHYGLKQKISSIEQALLMLGMDAVKNIAISSSVCQVFGRSPRKNGFNLKLFWWHSLACAVLARLLAAKTQYPSPEEAFLSGLMHDIGKILLWTNFEEQYAPALKAHGLRSAELLGAERRLGLTHPEAGAWLVGRWDLRSFMTDAVRYHHDPPDRVADSFPLVRIVYAANLLCPSDPAAEPGYAQAARIMELNPQDLRALREKAEAEVRGTARSLEIEIEPPEEPVSAGSAADQRKTRELVRLVRDYSLLQSICEGFLKASGAQAILEAVRRGLAVLFDLSRVLHFRLEGRALVSDPLNGIDGGNGLVIPFQESSSLAARSLLRGEVLSSLDRSASGPPSIYDEQLARLLGGEGILFLPLQAEQERLGVLAVAIRAEEGHHLAARNTLLRLLANQASLALYARRVQEQRAEHVREERLAASSALARRIVHEAQNPLGIISNYLSILGTKLKDNATIQDDLRIVREEIRRVSQIISELASFAAPGQVEKEPVDLNGLIADLAKISQESLWEMSHVRLELGLDPLVPAIHTAKDKLKQVLLNLIRNGAEAMSAGGTLRLETRYREEPPGRIEVLVLDQGPGIAEEVRARLFEPFVSTKGHEGLGLAIVHGILKELGGSIDYETGGTGTVFRIALPLS
jgi:HD-like signal output (HDOD) protein/signal transduction histidine kinase